MPAGGLALHTPRPGEAAFRRPARGGDRTWRSCDAGGAGTAEGPWPPRRSRAGSSSGTSPTRTIGTRRFSSRCPRASTWKRCSRPLATSSLITTRSACGGRARAATRRCATTRARPLPTIARIDLVGGRAAGSRDEHRDGRHDRPSGSSTFSGGPLRRGRPLRSRRGPRPAPARGPPSRRRRRLLEDPHRGSRDCVSRARPGSPVTAAARSASFQRWSEALADYAAKAELGDSLRRWLEIDAVDGTLAGGRPGRRREHGGAGRGPRRSSLGREETEALLQRVPAAYRTQINDVLLTALALALRAWTGREAHRIDMEGHGREEWIGPLDVSRTVGWFTTLYPVVLDLAGRPGRGLGLEARQGRTSPGAGPRPQLRRPPVRDRRDRERSAGRLAATAAGGAAVQLSRPVRSGRGRFGAVRIRATSRRAPGTDRRTSAPTASRSWPLVRDGRFEARWIYGAERDRPEVSRTPRRRLHRGAAAPDRALRRARRLGLHAVGLPAGPPRAGRPRSSRRTAPGHRGRLSALTDAAAVPLDGGRKRAARVRAVGLPPQRSAGPGGASRGVGGDRRAPRDAANGLRHRRSGRAAPGREAAGSAFPGPRRIGPAATRPDDRRPARVVPSLGSRARLRRRCGAACTA